MKSQQGAIRRSTIRWVNFGFLPVADFSPDSLLDLANALCSLGNRGSRKGLCSLKLAEMFGSSLLLSTKGDKLLLNASDNGIVLNETRLMSLLLGFNCRHSIFDLSGEIGNGLRDIGGYVAIERRHGSLH